VTVVPGRWVITKTPAGEQAARDVPGSRRDRALDQQRAVARVDRRAEREQLAGAKAREAVMAGQLDQDRAASR